MMLRAFSDEVDSGSSKKMRHNHRPRELRDCSAIVKGSRRLAGRALSSPRGRGEEKKLSQANGSRLFPDGQS